jgi:guanylate kinase
MQSGKRMVKLARYTEFRETLADYVMSDRARQALEGLKLVLLVAPTSTGRNTVIKELVENDNYYFVISDTTREPQVRDGKKEENGVHYFFRTEEEMLADLEAGEFLEAAIIHEQQVSGLSIRELEKAKSRGKVAITDIEIVGADNVMKAKPDTVAIFLLPPNFEVWQHRMASRGHMSEPELINRLKSAQKEFDAALHHDYYNFVVSDNVEQAAAIIDGIAHGKPNPHEGRGAGIIHSLQDNLQQKLASMYV